ncbi:UDP-galactopyranose mutase [Alicyclobacillus ferrooxydans]|uniref:UDP-galactopyranose mutase n=1 Tax=Alicyclobacillus ferrooxydans TaxID=471514 RepID=A0A0P9CAJ6_9BACL|nr:UDP-galactopyranose mutase [Alicyclobacillus ferrooxydans]KPV42448.1 UDP-galactopyranose mutase [Alicyclobacillus ferrooxydans]
MYDFLVVGAGFAGSVLAERLADAGKKVLIVDKRNHIGGNAYDFYNEHGILVHKYGPHIFHTNSEKVFHYLSRFTEWRQYEHRVLASVDGQLLPMPINATTINKFFGVNLNHDQVESFLAQRRNSFDRITNSQEVILAKVGTELYEKFFRGYTKKQWDLYPEQLDASVCARIPIRTNADDRYFTDIYQVMPAQGYTKMFERMLNHPNISVLLQTDYKKIQEEVRFNELIYTGPIDEYFDYVRGPLPYRSLRFDFETHEVSTYQPVATINYPNSYDFTRVTEFKYLTGQTHARTTIVKEFPTANGDPYYPIPTPENAEAYERYKAEIGKYDAVHFAGRLGTYRYYNMDQVVAQSLTLFNNLMSR